MTLLTQESLSVAENDKPVPNYIWTAGHSHSGHPRAMSTFRVQLGQTQSRIPKVCLRSI